MQRVSLVSVLAALAAVLSLSFLIGCGGGSSTNNTVSTIILTPTMISLNEGGVATLSAVAENSAGTVVAADISFASSNSSVATVSTGGLVCGGTWDANIINCNFTNGTAGVGTATITATSNGVNATTTVYVHEKVDQVQALLATQCTSMSQLVSISGRALTTSAPGCSTASPCDITSSVGPFTFGTNDTSIAVANTDGSLSAATPGATTVFASVSGVNSVGVPYLTCPVATILVHSSADSNTSFTLSPAGTQNLTADVYDTNNQYIKPTLTWGSSAIASATVAPTGSVNNPGTITAVAAGTAYITASCSYPDCNKYVNAQYSQNVVTATVTGSTSTTVYAASTNSKSLVPFNISTDNPGTAIALPNYPNSLVADPGGLAVYLGSASGIMAINVSTGAVTTFAVNGTIVAITPDGKYMLLSDPVGAVNYFSITAGGLAQSLPGVTVASSEYTPDSKFNEWVTGTSLGVGLPVSFSGITTLGYTSDTMSISGQGGLTYITGPTAHEIDVRSTCNQAEDQVLTANGPTLIAALPNATGAVAADSPAIDVVTTPATLNTGCPISTQSTINTYDLGAGSFTAQQIFVSPDNSRAWIVSNLPELLNFNLSTLAPTAIPLVGAPTAYDGGITLDGAHVYVGTSDGTVHRIDTASASDVAQIAVGLKDANGNVTVPNLIVVLP